MSEHENSEAFRERLANSAKDGKRIWIYPKIIKGIFYKYRTYLSWFLLSFFFAAPFLKIGGQPLLLLNVIERKFVIFGQPFWPQDFIVFVFFALTFLVFIVLFTVVYGRVFCGWACPQTIFMEMVFRKIENWIEGSATQQRKLDAMPWNREKIFKKSAKHLIFYAISFLIAHTFLAYIIGYEALWAKISGSLSENYLTLAGLIIFSFVFYLVFAKMRELVCIMVCPYGRLQGVMLDSNSMVVSYDFVRGEPRAKLKRGADNSDKGDCIECGLCVDVCPTGIDIRNGTQLECVNCTACMDACDSVMEKINKPKGLIRIDSIKNIESGKKGGLKYSTRMIAYTIVMLLLLSASIGIVLTRKSVDAHILRVPGQTYTEQEDGTVINLFNVQLVNKTFEDKAFELKLKNNLGNLVMVNTNNELKANADNRSVFMINVPPGKITENKTEMEIDVLVNGKVLKTIKTVFLAPVRE
jgi:cytochrome c oxidase accessory protein FixG